MSKKPIDRPQTAGEVAAMLKEWLADRGKSLGGHTIEPREPGHGSGVGSGVFTRFSLGVPTPSSGKAPASGSSRTISVSDRDTKKLDEKSGAGGPEEEIGLAPLDEEDVLGVANRRPHEEAGSRLRQAGRFDERSGDVERHRVSGFQDRLKDWLQVGSRFRKIAVAAGRRAARSGNGTDEAENRAASPV